MDAHEHISRGHLPDHHPRSVLNLVNIRLYKRTDVRVNSAMQFENKLYRVESHLLCHHPLGPGVVAHWVVHKCRLRGRGHHCRFLRPSMGKAQRLKGGRANLGGDIPTRIGITLCRFAYARHFFVPFMPVLTRALFLGSPSCRQ